MKFELKNSWWNQSLKYTYNSEQIIRQASRSNWWRWWIKIEICSIRKCYVGRTKAMRNSFTSLHAVLVRWGMKTTMEAAAHEVVMRFTLSLSCSKLCTRQSYIPKSPLSDPSTSRTDVYQPYHSILLHCIYMLYKPSPFQIDREIRGYYVAWIPR